METGEEGGSDSGADVPGWRAAPSVSLESTLKEGEREGSNHGCTGKVGDYINVQKKNGVQNLPRTAEPAPEPVA